MLGDVPGGEYSSSGLGISADGSVVVGSSQDATSSVWFRWTPSGGMVSLGAGTAAKGVSGDGSIIVGGSSGAAIWTAGTGINTIVPPAGFQTATASDISPDGNAVLGNGSGNSGNGPAVPFIWSQGGDVEVLPLAPDASASFGTSISDDHSVIAGC